MSAQTQSVKPTVPVLCSKSIMGVQAVVDRRSRDRVGLDLPDPVLLHSPEKLLISEDERSKVSFWPPLY